MVYVCSDPELEGSYRFECPECQNTILLFKKKIKLEGGRFFLRTFLIRKNEEEVINSLREEGFHLILEERYKYDFIEEVGYDRIEDLSKKDLEHIGLVSSMRFEEWEEMIEDGMTENPEYPFLAIRNGDEELVAKIDAYVLLEEASAEENIINFSIGVSESYRGIGLSKWLLSEMVTFALCNNIKIIRADLINESFGRYLKEFFNKQKGFESKIYEGNGNPTLIIDLDPNEEKLSYE